MARGAVLGADLGAFLAMADALGIDRYWAATLLPFVEPVLVAHTNARLSAGADPFAVADD